MPPAAGEPTIAAGLARQIVDLAARWGVSAAELLEGLDLDLAAVSDPHRRLSVASFDRLSARAKALTGEPGLGFYLGLSARVSAYGYLGFAALASPTLGEALDLAVRFSPTRTDALALRLSTRGEAASLVIEERAALGAGADVLVLSLLVGLREIAVALTGRTVDDGADVAFPEPAWAARFAHLTRGRMRFGQPAHRIVFPAAALAFPIAFADPGAQQLAREQLEGELAALGLEESASSRVRARLAHERGGFRTLPEIARLLHLSPRTLKRRLADEGTDFTALLDDERRARALLLLRAPGASVAAIADDLGYSDVANFTRAFRRWTGETPTAYRRGAAR
jgi:AraC-like DNA-binding protein